MADENENEEVSEIVETEETKAQTLEKGKKFTQILGASICMLGGFTLGLGIGWSSPADSINKGLNKSANGTNSDYVDIINQMHWVGSLYNVGAMLVMFPIGFVLDIVGRKITMLIIAPCASASFVLLAALHKLPAWIVGRILLGFFSAAFCVAAPIYVAEISEASIRGTLGVFFQLLLVMGITVEFALGKANDVRILGYVSAAFPILFFIAFIFVPESPKFHIMKGKTDSAKKALQWYRGKKCDVTAELAVMEHTVEEALESKSSFKELFSTRAARRSLGMAAILMIFQQLSGINILMFYASKIFSDAGSKLSDIDSSIILAVVQIFWDSNIYFHCGQSWEKDFVVCFAFWDVYFLDMHGWMANISGKR
ncbi:hypothetical protein L9F63_000171 [Diploptera punctata]|uniref:Major facilitator superfamily (MFS) profile domain-containing protein n=1 Tax=Diploptera punctata TaxID=6984 RepID=A0AAD8AM59_DIPPU|nr:hypothetical protein L9F63_000171 [Diploptera punctata]